MAFDLAKAAGYDKIVSNLDTQEIVQVSCDRIDANEKNFFSVDDVQDLAESIQVNGILQPLLLIPTGNRYRIVAGHRRFKAAGEIGLKTVPAVILPEMSESMEWFVLMQTNTTSRQLSYAEKQEAAIRLKKHLVQLKEEGHKIPGRLRDIVAEQLELSRTEVARMEVIEKNLVPEAKELMKTGEMSAAAAYAMAKTSPECQREILAEKPAVFIPSVISDHAVRRGLDYLNPDCEHPKEWWQCKERKQGRKLPCPDWKNIKKHKDKGHPENCPGCCAKCEKYKSGYKCPDVCDNFKRACAAKKQKEAAEKQRDSLAETKQRFLSAAVSEIPGMVEQLKPSADVSYVTLIDWLVARVLQGGSGGWHKYPEQCPRDGQTVIVFFRVAKITMQGRYVYRAGQWYSPDFADASHDEPATVKEVVAWIELPEGV